MMSDLLYRGTIPDANIRFSYCVTSNLINTLILDHNCDPVTGHLFGRAISGAVLLSPTLTDDERYTIRWHYEGLLKSIVVDIASSAQVRALIRPNNFTGTVSDSSELFGDKGTVSVVKSTRSSVLNSGTSRAEMLDVIDDLSLHFSVSDQIETAMTVMIGFDSDPTCPVHLCQGILLQAMPDCDLKEFDKIRNRLNASKVRELLSQAPEQDNYIELIFQHLFDQKPSPTIRLFGQKSAEFRCECNYEKVREILKVMDSSEQEELEKQGKPIRIQCQFCSKFYTIMP